MKGKKIKRALVSVYDKTGVVELAKSLGQLSVEIISTGGTASLLEENDIPVVRVSEITEFPEILGGRVKTLHPRVFGGILAKRNEAEQMHQLEEMDIAAIDLVVVNLYPFEATIQKEGVSLAEALENIDIGGPSMIRAAAKNFPSVAVVTDPKQYDGIVAELKECEGSLCEETRQRLARQAFRRTWQYDAAIANYLASEEEETSSLPEILSLNIRKVQELRYGENPHQAAALYADRHEVKSHEIFGKQLQGKELSFNNILDGSAVIGMLHEIDQPCAVIVKHSNPCGVAINDDIAKAFESALATDPVSAFGGIVGFNKKVTGELAQALAKMFLEVIIAPKFSEEAQQIFAKKKNLRLLEWPENRWELAGMDIKKVVGGYLLQRMDKLKSENEEKYRVVTQRQPTEDEWAAMRFGWKVVKWVKSNAVIFVSKNQTLGIGAGQMSRVDSSNLAVHKAKQSGLSLKGSVAASDAFFPFRDGVDAIAKAGATAVIQPGGSIRDKEVIDAANELGIAMVFTGTRHFRH